MDHVALDRSRTHDRHLDHQIVEDLRLQPRQHVDLRPALDLEDADRVPLAQHVIDVGLFGGNGRQVMVDALMQVHQVEGLSDAGQHAQRQHIDLHQAQFVDIVLVPFDESAVGHGGIADRDQFIQPSARQDKSPDVLRQMPREPHDPPRHIHRPADHGIGRVHTRLLDPFVGDGGAPAAPLGPGQPGGDILGQSQRLADLADGAARAIADDGRGNPGSLAAISPVDVLDDFFPALVLEIDVDIGRFVAVC